MGLDGVQVNGVREVRGSLEVEDRPVVRVRDLPIADRSSFLVRRKRRHRCRVCWRTFTETHPELPARQRVSARFRRLLLERVQGGRRARRGRPRGAHRCGRELATVVSDLDRRRVIEVLDGRSRRRIERYLRSRPADARRAIEVVPIDPYDAYRQAIRAELPPRGSSATTSIWSAARTRR